MAVKTAKDKGGVGETINIADMSQEQFEKFLLAVRDGTVTAMTPTTMNRDYGYCIVVLSHGFVYIGDVALVGEELTIGRALNIRQWGTTKGLGQLSIEGPQKETVLDRCGAITAPKLALIHIMAVTEDAKAKWMRNSALVGHR